MSKVKNVAKIKNPLIVAIREQLEHRASWLWLLCDEAGKKGLKWEDFASAAIGRCGHWQAEGFIEEGNTTSLKGLRKTLFTKPAQWVFEMDVKECTDDRLYIDFHYCPLVKAWQKLGCTDEDISRLCDIAMCGDRAIADSYGCVLTLGETIANGSDICEIRIDRKKA